MKKILFLVVLLLGLLGCQANEVVVVQDKVKPTKVEDITTFKEVIKDGKVDIDGIVYDVKVTGTSNRSYDDQGNLVEAINTNDSGEARTENIYKDNLLVQSISYFDGALSTTTNYYYDEEKDLAQSMSYSDGELKNTENNYYDKEKRIVKKERIKGKLALVEEYIYGDHEKKTLAYDSNGALNFTTTCILNDADQIISSSSVNADGTAGDTWTMKYADDLKVQAIRKIGNSVTTHNYMYNNLGDCIMDYCVMKENAIQLRVEFYVYAYYETMLPKTKTIYFAFGPIDEGKIRKFE